MEHQGEREESEVQEQEKLAEHSENESDSDSIKNESTKNKDEGKTGSRGINALNQRKIKEESGSRKKIKRREKQKYLIYGKERNQRLDETSDNKTSRP